LAEEVKKMSSVKITGLDRLQSQLQEAQRGFEALNGEIASLRFSPGDPVGVARAIQEMEAAVDAKTALYAGNPLVSKVANAMKKGFRERIQSKATSGVEE
jgi:hypothetical protein